MSDTPLQIIEKGGIVKCTTKRCTNSVPYKYIRNIKN